MRPPAVRVADSCLLFRSLHHDFPAVDFCRPERLVSLGLNFARGEDAIATHSGRAREADLAQVPTIEPHQNRDRLPAPEIADQGPRFAIGEVPHLTGACLRVAGFELDG